tara:strand:+ start:16078 stop:16299 length:222 start_codon:yes stop_codon:yes gene_type:complete
MDPSPFKMVGYSGSVGSSKITPPFAHCIFLLKGFCRLIATLFGWVSMTVYIIGGQDTNAAMLGNYALSLIACL